MRNQSLWPQPSWLPRVDDCSRLRTRKEVIGITGAGGVLGSILRERLQDSGCNVHSFAGDVRDLGRVDGWVQGLRPTMLFHLAAVVPVDKVEGNPIEAWTTNVVGAVNVAVAACGFTFLPWRPWVLLCSSSHAAAPLASLYAASKHAAELAAAPLLERSGVPHCIARVFSFSHAKQRAPFLVPSLFAQAATSRTVPIKNSNAVRDIMDAESVVDALLHLALKRHSGRVEVGSGVGRTVGEIARWVIGKAVEMGGGELDVQVADVTALRSIVGAR